MNSENAFLRSLRRGNNFIEEDLFDLKQLVRAVIENRYGLQKFFEQSDIKNLTADEIMPKEKRKCILRVLNEKILADVNFHLIYEELFDEIIGAANTEGHRLREHFDETARMRLNDAVVSSKEKRAIIKTGLQKINELSSTCCQQDKQGTLALGLAIVKMKDIEEIELRDAYESLKQDDKSTVRKGNIQILCKLFPDAIRLFKPAVIYEERRLSSLCSSESEIDVARVVNILMRVVKNYARNRSLYWFLRYLCFDESEKDRQSTRLYRLANTQRDSLLSWLKNNDWAMILQNCGGSKADVRRFGTVEQLLTGIEQMLKNRGIKQDDMETLLLKDRDIFRIVFKELLKSYGSRRAISTFLDDCEAGMMTNSGSAQKKRFGDFLFNEYSSLINDKKFSNLTRYEDIIFVPDKNPRNSLLDEMEQALRDSEISFSDRERVCIRRAGNHTNNADGS